MPVNDSPDFRRVAFVSTRIAGTDGVSLEIRKWADVLTRMGLECFYITGESDRPADRTELIAEAHFDHATIRDITSQAFGVETRTEELTMTILETTNRLRGRLQNALDRFEPDLLIAENALTIPMNVPLGLALLQLIQQTGIDCIAHHHDFVWERERYLINSIDDFIASAFPPPLHQIHHVVINRPAGEEFSRRTGQPCRIIPNVMDFDRPPPPPDEYALQFRRQIGLAPDDVLILQPTRVVARKAIERSVELIRRLDDPRAKLVITHDVGDEGTEYADYIRNFADLLRVEVIFASACIGEERGTTADGHRQFTMQDVYPQADLVTYPSTYEGFGNAFLEAVYYRRPIVCNRYSIYRTEIEPSGLRPITFDGFVTEALVEEVRSVLQDPQRRSEMVEHNFRIARRHFSYHVLERQLRAILEWLQICSKRYDDGCKPAEGGARRAE